MDEEKKEPLNDKNERKMDEKPNEATSHKAPINQNSEQEGQKSDIVKTPIPAESAKESKLERYLLFMIYNENTAISRDDIFDVVEQLDKIAIQPEETRIDMVLLSNGGFPHPAYQIMNIIRAKCKKLKAIVPLYAKSAATLMTLAADEIVMGPQSEIGPIDMQMEHPLIQNLHISALEGYYPFMQLYNKFVTEFFPMALQMADTIAMNVAIKREDAVDIALNTAIGYLNPIVSQINPTIVNMCYRALATGETYSYNFLYRYMLKDKPERERAILAAQTAHLLVWNFQNHGQVIARDDAKLLNLYVGYGENYDIFNMIYVITKEMLTILSQGSAKKAIRLISMEQLKRLLNVDSYLGYITFISYKAYSLVFPLREALKNVTDSERISLSIRQALSQSIASMPPIPEAEKNDIAQISIELLEDIFIRNFKDENAIYSVIYNRILKEKAFSKPVTEVVAGRIVEAVKELTATIEIEIDRTPPEVVSKYVLQILAFLLAYNIKF